MGAGVGFTASILSPLFDNYTVQDRKDNAQLLKNNLKDTCDFIYGDWGSKELAEQLRSYDLVLMADCFYSKSQFPFLLATIRECFERNHQARVVCIHHHRK